MSKFRALASNPNGKQPDGRPSWYAEMASLFPEVAGILAGVPAEGDQPAVPPYSIILSDRQGRLQACISRQESSDMWFITIDAPKAILEELEAKIALQEVTHQTKRGKPR